MSNFIIKRGNLSFYQNENGTFNCVELQRIPDEFNAKYSQDKELQEDMKKRINKFLETCEIRTSDKTLSSEEKKETGRESLTAALQELEEPLIGKTVFERFLFWLGDWWYYYPPIQKSICFTDSSSIRNSAVEMVKKYLLPLIPEQVKKIVKGFDVCIAAVGYGHFCIEFIFRETGTRYIVTDTQLIELRGVSGYIYLDILPDGMPVARSRCGRGGGRAFFDGLRLMSHKKFKTCASKTAVIDGGYKVNSTECTIINGRLFDLVDADDPVAYTTGAEGGIFSCWTFSREEAVKSQEVGQESAKQLKAESDEVFLGRKKLVPLGMFLPSPVKLLDSGFSLYDWSEYERNNDISQNRVLAVDGQAPWLDSVKMALQHKTPDIHFIRTEDKNQALGMIVAVDPNILILDMHLTSDEQFDGLWISNQLITKKFRGKLLIASNYGAASLKAMQTLIKCEAHIPGKNIEKIMKCIMGDCDCLNN